MKHDDEDTSMLGEGGRTVGCALLRDDLVQPVRVVQVVVRAVVVRHQDDVQQRAVAQEALVALALVRVLHRAHDYGQQVVVAVAAEGATVGAGPPLLKIPRIRLSTLESGSGPSNL